MHSQEQRLTSPWTEDPEFVRLYDVENQDLWDLDFYRDLVLELGAEHVLDIGCGTGGFAVELARRQLSVTGVDPSAVMIEVAQRQAHDAGVSDRVSLIQDTTAELAASSSSAFDAAIMMGHVAQYFLNRADWDAVLAQTFQALKPGGWLSFESRNPKGMSADAWDEESTRETQPHPDGGEFTSWLEVVGMERDDADGPLITARGHNIFPDGRHVSADEPLRYRPLPVLLESLRQAGFEVKKVWGDWDRSPVAEDSPELIVLARRPS